ncbi:MAG: hypothetical protein RLZZ458_221 [Planctomycetota bacterium]
MVGVQVVAVRHFHNGVDVLDGAGKTDGANAAATALDGRTILASAGQNGALAANAVVLCDSFKVFHQSHIGEHGGVHDMQADTFASDRDAFFIGDARCFAAECGIAGDGDIRFGPEGCRAGTAHADFFLYGPDCVDFTGMVCEVFDGANQSPAADAVIKALGDDGVADFVKGAIEHDHVADANAAFDFVGGESTVDEEFGDFGNFLFVGFCGEMNRATSGVHDAGDVAVGSTDADGACEEVAGVEATGWVDTQVSLFVNVAHQKANLIHVGHEQDFGGLCGERLSGGWPGMADSQQRPHGIDGNFVEQAGGSDMVLNHRANAFFAAGDGRGLGQLLQEVHGASLCACVCD